MSPMRTAPGAARSTDGRLRARYVDEVLDILYPPPCRPDAAFPAAARPGTAEYLVVPSLRRPRLLVPAGDLRLAAAAVRRYAEPTSWTARLGRDAVVAALRTGASRALLRGRIRVAVPAGSDTFERYLADALGRPDLSVSIHIGPVRANRKPVLQVLEPGGTTVAFVKLGVTALTRTLVRAEATALDCLRHAALSRLTVPAVLHIGQWNDHEVLVLAALPTWDRRAPLTEHRLAAAMAELAGCYGTRRGPLAGNGYPDRLRARLAAVADRGEGRQLAAATERILASAAATGVRLAFGAWHGDWAPWNMAALDDRLLVWDWERFTPGVPAGFDALHHDLQRRLIGWSGRVDARASVDATVDAAPDLLRPFGQTEPDAAEVTALLYLVDLATRYLTDRQAEAGARLGVLGTWLLPALLTRVGAL
jgi:hypothetical protein